MVSYPFRILCPGCCELLKVVPFQQPGFFFANDAMRAHPSINKCNNAACPIYIEGAADENGNKEAIEAANWEEAVGDGEIRTPKNKGRAAPDNFDINLVDPLLRAQMEQEQATPAAAADDDSDGFINQANNNNDDVFYDGSNPISAGAHTPDYLQGPTQPGSYSKLHDALAAAARGDKGPLLQIQALQAQQATEAQQAAAQYHQQQNVFAHLATGAHSTTAATTTTTTTTTAAAAAAAAHHDASFLMAHQQHQEQQTRILQNIQAARVLQASRPPRHAAAAAAAAPDPARTLTAPSSFKVVKKKAAAGKQVRSQYFAWEEEIILILRAAGHSFGEISERLPRHTTRSIETKWHVLTKGRKRSGSNPKPRKQEQQQDDGDVGTFQTE